MTRPKICPKCGGEEIRPAVFKVPLPLSWNFGMLETSGWYCPRCVASNINVQSENGGNNDYKTRADGHKEMDVTCPCGTIYRIIFDSEEQFKKGLKKINEMPEESERFIEINMIGK